ncbi:MAG: chorismate synthase, partial [Polyangiaceae bacterium]|nr:chorismate synthase [Polyangiaceae bacterium]
MLTRLRFLSAGESHGPCLTGVLDGLPAGLRLYPSAIDEQLQRRQTGFGAGARMLIESDRVRLSGGWMGGKTTGGPLAFEVANRDFENWKERDILPMMIPRPGHADLTGAIKFGHRDLRLALERASARETAVRVVAGAACRQLLAEFGIELGGYVTSIGGVHVTLDSEASAQEHRRRATAALQNDLACPDEPALDSMRTTIGACKKQGDTLGGTFVVFALGVPPGLGSYTQWDRRLHARIAMALMSIQAVKGVEIGPAFDNAALPGSQVHDEILRDDQGNLHRATNRAGGFEGGVTTGSPIVARVAKKPISTTLEPRRSVHLGTGAPASTV